MAVKSVEICFKFCLIFIVGGIVTHISGANLPHQPPPDLPIRKPGVIPDSLSIENIQLEGSRKTKTTKEPPASSQVITTTTTAAPPSEEGLVRYRLSSTDTGIACILIETDGLLVFNYKTTLKGELESDAYMPERYEVDGRCDEDDRAFITISWKSFGLTISFSKTPGAERWFVKQVELTADSTDRVFEHINRPAGTLHFINTTNQFGTPVGMAYTCEDEKAIDMNDGDVRATLLLRKLRMQPFIYKKDDFGPDYMCLRGAKSYRDETAPIAVGSTLAIVTLLTVSGYGIYRYMKVKKVQYDTME